MKAILLLFLIAFYQACAWQISSLSSYHGRATGIFMGRAAAVRANTKARTDSAKAKNNGRFAKKIIIAVKAGGIDPVVNRLLAQVISEAKAANVPKDIITRNIEKANSATAADYKESVFEFYGHGGAGILVNVLTDNDNRAAAEVNLVAKKHNLRPANSNAVKFKFKKFARFDVKSMVDEDKLMDWCIERGIDDYELRTELNACPLNPQEANHCVLYVDPKDMSSMREVLKENQYELETKQANVPIEGFIPLQDSDFDANLAAIDAFEALDDVDSVEHNIDLVAGDDEE